MLKAVQPRKNKVIERLRRRSNRSAITPPIAPNPTCPNPISPATAPTQNAESVVSKTNQPCASFSMDITSETRKFENHNHRKLLSRKIGKSHNTHDILDTVKFLQINPLFDTVDWIYGKPGPASACYSSHRCLSESGPLYGTSCRIFLTQNTDQIFHCTRRRKTAAVRSTATTRIKYQMSSKVTCV